MSEAAAVFSLMANHVWQSVLLAALLAMLLAARSWLSAQTRHTLAFGALAAGALLPLAMLLPGNEVLMRLVAATGMTLPTAERVETATPETIQPVVVLTPEQLQRDFARGPAASHALSKGWRGYATTSAGGSDGWTGSAQTPEQPVEPSAIDAVAVESAAVEAAAAKPVAFPFEFDLHRRPAVLWSMVGLWLAIAAILLVRVGADVLAAERLRRRASPIALPRPLAHLVGDIDVRESVQAPGPMAAGLLTSSIILPPGFIAERSPQELLGLLEHERAHVARGDLRLALLQRILTAVFWWSPAMHWISARVEEEREMACDEAAAHRVGDARAFAKTLTEHAQAQLFWGWPRLVVGAARRRSQLGRRVRRLLDIAGSRARPIGLTARASVGVLLAAVAATALATPRLAAQDDDDRAGPAPRAEPAPDARPARPARPTAAPEAPTAPTAEAEQLTQAQEDLADAEREVRRAQDQLNDAVNNLANRRGRGDTEELQQAVEEATEEYAEAQAELAEAAQEMQRAFVTVDVRPGRNGRGAGVSVDVRGPTPAEAAQIGESVGALAEAFGEQMDNFDFDWDFKGENFAQLQNMRGGPGVYVSGWGGDRGDSPLLTAVRSGDVEMVQVLVDAGADINGPNDCGCALVTAIRSSATEIVAYLLEKGADPNVGGQGDGSPLMIAVRMGDAEMVQQLAEAGADVNANVANQGTPLLTAVRMGDVEMVRALIEHGADVEGADADESENDGRF